MELEKGAKFSIRRQLKTFGYSFDGLKTVFKEEHNARIHLAISIVVVIMGFVFQISMMEWIIVCILIGLVLGMEIMNTAVENLCNYVSPQWHEIIKKVKDMASAAVFLSACVATIADSLFFCQNISNSINFRADNYYIL